MPVWRPLVLLGVLFRYPFFLSVVIVYQYLLLQGVFPLQSSLKNEHIVQQKAKSQICMYSKNPCSIGRNTLFLHHLTTHHFLQKLLEIISAGKV